LPYFRLKEELQVNEGLAATGVNLEIVPQPNFSNSMSRVICCNNNLMPAIPARTRCLIGTDITTIFFGGFGRG
jgi:hypothetical protein